MIKQKNIIKEYENWINLLINLINRSKAIEGKKDTHDDYASIIQNQIQRISKIENENLELKLRLIEEAKITKDLENKKKEIDKKKTLIYSDLDFINSNDDAKSNKLYNNNSFSYYSNVIKCLKDDNIKLNKNIELILEELNKVDFINKKYETKDYSDNSIDNQILKAISLNKEIKYYKELKNKLTLLHKDTNIIPLDYYDKQRSLSHKKLIIINPNNKVKLNSRHKSFINKIDFNTNIFSSCLSNNKDNLNDNINTLYS